MEKLDVLDIGIDNDIYNNFFNKLKSDKVLVKKNIRKLKKESVFLKVLDPFNDKGDFLRYKSVIKKNEEYNSEISIYLEAIDYIDNLTFLKMLISSYEQLTGHYDDYKKYSDSLVTGCSCNYDCILKPDMNFVKNFVKSNRIKSLNK